MKSLRFSGFVLYFSSIKDFPTVPPKPEGFGKADFTIPLGPLVMPSGKEEKVGRITFSLNHHYPLIKRIEKMYNEYLGTV